MRRGNALRAGASGWGVWVREVLSEVRARYRPVTRRGIRMIRGFVGGVTGVRCPSCGSPDPVMYREGQWPLCQHRWHAGRRTRLRFPRAVKDRSNRMHEMEGLSTPW